MSYKETIKTIQNHFHDLINSITDFSSSFFSAALAAVEKSGGKVLEDAALAAVQAAESAGGSGGDKFAAAFAAVIEVLTEQGIPTITHAVNFAIEAAVAQIKAGE